jgi:hypothetical protein
MNEIKTLSVIWGVFGAFQVVVGIVFAVMFGMFGFIPLLSGDDEGVMVGGIFMIFAVVFGLMFVAFSVPGLLAAWGMSKGKKWGAIVAAILSVFLLFNFPMGTLIGGYTLYLLSKPENQAALT